MNNMKVSIMNQVLRSIAAGSALLLTTAPGLAGHLYPVGPSRPHVSASYAPQWGFNQTCWQRFPPVPPCDSGAGCVADSYGSSLGTVDDFSQLGMIYAPQSGLVPIQESLTNQPISVLPQGLGSQRYSNGIATPSPVGEQLVPARPSNVLPGQSMPSPEVRTFQAAPLPLPPLPSSPPAVPGVPGQSSALPHRQMFGEGERLADTANSIQSGSSRYGHRSANMNTRTQMASAQGTMIPVTTVSQGRAVGTAIGGSRYGAATMNRRTVEPSFSGPAGTYLEPQQRKLSIPYQR